MPPGDTSLPGLPPGIVFPPGVVTPEPDPAGILLDQIMASLSSSNGTTDLVSKITSPRRSWDQLLLTITAGMSKHDDVIKWKTFPRYWPFMRGIHRSPVNSPHKGQWRGPLMFSLIIDLNKRLGKQSWGWWFETPSSLLWRHCNVTLWSICLFAYNPFYSYIRGRPSTNIFIGLKCSMFVPIFDI